MAKLNYNGNPFASAVSYTDLSDAPLINGNKISSDSTSRSLQIVWKGTIEQYKALPEKNNECIYIILEPGQEDMIINTAEGSLVKYLKKQVFTLHTENKLVSNAINEINRNIGNLDSFIVDDKDTAMDGVASTRAVIGQKEDLISQIGVSIVDSLNEAYPGDRSNLKTTTKQNIVSSINEVNTNEGAIENLITTNKSSLVNSINEINSTIGNRSLLKTTAKLSTVSAIDELDGDIGALTSLTTTNKTSIVNAVNDHDTKIGDLSTLKTSTKTNLVDAINEIIPVEQDKDLNVSTTGNGATLSNIFARYVAKDTIFLSFDVKFTRDFANNEATLTFTNATKIDGKEIEPYQSLTGWHANNLGTKYYGFLVSGYVLTKNCFRICGYRAFRNGETVHLSGIMKLV